MYITAVPNRGAKPTQLLRESYRENGKVKNRTLANLSKLPPEAIDALRRVLAGEALVSAQEAVDIECSAQHGHVEAVLTAIKRLGLDEIISSRRCAERDLVIAMIAARILAPASKLETTRWWESTTLLEELGLPEVREDALYAAMDWLLQRQPEIEKKLAAKHLEPCGLVLYDLSSTYVEGTACPLAALGYNRDGKKGKLQINFGLLTDEDGRPVAVSVYEGRVGDPSTVRDQIKTLKERFELDLLVFVGDRGMVTQKQIESFEDEGGIEWITALKSGAIKKLQTQGHLQLGLFDERNIFEVESPLFPGERLVACRNPELAEHRARKRESLISATKKELEKVRAMVDRGSLTGRAEIGLRIGRVINKHKVAKHFKLEIGERVFSYRVREEKVRAEAALDGIYVIRTSVPREIISTEDAVRHYKKLARVERAFRSMKSVSLKVRPIYHWLEHRVRAHILLCMLAYYVEWHMRRAWAELLFAEEEDDLDTRDPVAPAEPSTVARAKARKKKNAAGLAVQSFKSLLGRLAGIVRNSCHRKNAPNAEPSFSMTTRPNPLQARALELIRAL